MADEPGCPDVSGHPHARVACCFFVFHTELLKTAPVSPGAYPLVSVWRGAGLILLRSRCVAFGDRATEMWAFLPAVRLQCAEVVRVGACRSYRAFGLYLAARSINTIRLVPTPSKRLSRFATAGFPPPFDRHPISSGSQTGWRNASLR